MKFARIEKIIKKMNEENIDQLIVSSQSSIFYITGEMINPKERLLVICIDKDGRTVLVANKLFNELDKLDVEKLWYDDSMNPVELLSTVIKENVTVAVDKIWHAHFFMNLISLKKANYVADSKIMCNVRMIKDEEEKQLMRETCRVNETVLHELTGFVRDGITEYELAKNLHELYNKYGANGYEITPVVSFGKTAAEPHHRPDCTVLKNGDCMVMDMGARTNGYRSDMTRTMFYKEVSIQMEKIYNIVLRAQLTALDSIKIGMKFCDIDKIARDIIADEGYGQYFTHRLGHGIGIDGHEFPYVESKSEVVVQEGMVFSVEPGIYVPNLGGVRIEDLVVVNADGIENLYTLPKELKILG